MSGFGIGRIAAAIAVGLCAVSAAHAGPSIFDGPHLGIAAGAVDHHFVLVDEDQMGTERRFNVTRWGIGGEGFAGYDALLSPHVLLGGEAAFQFGGKTAAERNSSYSIGIKPRWGFSLTARAGYVIANTVMVFAGGGYGQHHYRAFSSQPGAADGLERTSSFVLRGGFELAASHHAHLRLEFQHLDGTRNQFMIGVPFRF